MIYKGGCHCGKVAIEVEGELTAALECNCSICARKGALLWAVSRDKLRPLTPEANLARYTFNKHAIAHRFCRECGMHPFSEDTGSCTERSAYVNLRCLEGIDLAAIPVQQFDGRSM